MADIETVKELKVKILKKISEEELNKRYLEKSELNPLFKSNKRMAYYIIANELGTDLKVNIASSSKEAFPLKINEIQDSEKTNFNISGYVISEPRIILTKTGKNMLIMSIADDTGIISFSSFNENNDSILNKELKVGDFITVSNLFWSDKSTFMPYFGQYSNVKKGETSLNLIDVTVNSIAQMGNNQYYTIKGIIAYIPNGQKREIYHCENGHWFKSLSDKDIGSLSMCEKCGTPMLVEKHISAQGVLFADANGEVELDISVFARLEDINIMDEFIFTGKYVDGVFKVMEGVPLKKK